MHLSHFCVIFVLCFGVLNTSASNAPSLETLSHFVMYSYASGCRVGLQNWTCFWCNYLTTLPPVSVATVFMSDGVYGTYGYIGTTENSIIIAFRGSESFENWLHDLDFFKTTYPGFPGLEVHEGFLSAYQAVQPTILSYVSILRKKYPNFPVYVTGHSLGGALSVLCAFDLVVTSGVPSSSISVINLGQPRVGNSLFASKWNQLIGSSFRLVNQRDLVPHVPPELFGFQHSSTELWFPSNYTSFIVCDNSGEDPSCSDSLDFFNPADHLWYLGFNAHLGVKKQCGPIKEYSSARTTYKTKI